MVNQSYSWTELPFFKAAGEPNPADYRGIETYQCPCGCDLVLMCASFDPDTGLPGYYALDGVCAGCGALLTLPVPTEEQMDSY